MTAATASSGTRHLADAQAIHDALRVLRDEQVAVQLRFDGHPTAYRSRVLDVDPKARVFVLDKLQPGGGHALMNARSTFALSARNDGLYLYAATNRVAAVEVERGLPYYRVPFPDSVLLQHRRAAPRLPISRYVEAIGQFTLQPRGQTLAGRLVDLSNGGLRVEFDGMLQPLPDTPDQFDPAAIRLPDGRDLTFAAQVRHAHYIAERDVTLCGAEFASMDIRNRRLLNAFIERIGRQLTAPA